MRLVQRLASVFLTIAAMAGRAYVRVAGALLLNARARVGETGTQKLRSCSAGRKTKELCVMYAVLDRAGMIKASGRLRSQRVRVGRALGVPALFFAVARVLLL